MGLFNRTANTNDAPAETGLSVVAPDAPRANSHAKPPRKQNFLTRAISDWCARLLGVINNRSFHDEQDYGSHRTTLDYVWNTVGFTAWGMVFPLLTMVVTQLAGVDQAGRFSMAFVVASLLMILANFGIRTYQVSDVQERHSFTEYQLNRLITCLAMMVVGHLYCTIRGYDANMMSMCFAVFAYRMVDGLADVYEGRLQQKDKLYLAGISLSVRSLLAFVAFCLGLLVTGNLVVASAAMAIVALACFCFVTFPLAKLETPKSGPSSAQGVFELFKHCWPLFVALFMYALIDNMPKFMMEGVLTYDNQLYFNALYFPAQTILMMVGFVYKPQLVTMTNAWNDASKHKRFDLFIVVMVLLIVLVTVVVALVMAWIGIPLMSLLYGIDFEQFRGLCYVMLAAGGVTGIIDFLYQVITILRKQQVVMKLYLITFAFSLFVPVLLINFTGLPGAVLSYLIVMSILAVLLAWEYLKVRIGFSREGAEPVQPANDQPAQPQATPQEPAAPRQLREAPQPRRPRSEPRSRTK
ncbi:MAG: lipopolysaccharide biosynthesis protein [Coriobacteriia bacterium]|nr:lipopolysaccharide biosynthesis protein [Coriobacteriia bacterium]